MVTPFNQDGTLDLAGVARLADHLVELGNDTLVVNGTTGESATTSDAEKSLVVRATVDAVGQRARVIAGVGTNNTQHSLELATQAAKAGAHALLAVTPYYNKPPQAGLIAHFTAVADATELSVMLYDIPGRTGTPLEVETLVRLAEHPRIVAVKDAKGDFAAASWTMARTDLDFYSGDDMNNLPFLAIGACGFVSVAGHLVADRLREMLDAYDGGAVQRAIQIHRGLLPVYTGIFRTQGVITTKAALIQQRLPAGPVRPPLVAATPAELATLRTDLAAGGVTLEEFYQT